MMSDQSDRNAGGLWAGGSVAGAIFASSCCIAPLVFISLGISGAWIGNLTALEPFKWVFISLATVFIVMGFRHHRNREHSCEDTRDCVRPRSSRLVTMALWLASTLVAASASSDMWAPLFY